jgi:hypothetical protein
MTPIIDENPDTVHFPNESARGSSVPYVQDDLYDRMTRSGGSGSPADERRKWHDRDCTWTRANPVAGTPARPCSCGFAAEQDAAPSTPVDEAERPMRRRWCEIDGPHDRHPSEWGGDICPGAVPEDLDTMPIAPHPWTDTPPALSTPVDERPESDADQLREAANWLDTYDQMARVFFDILARSDQMPDDQQQQAKALIPAASSNEVQTDLRRIADSLDAPAPPVSPPVASSIEYWARRLADRTGCTLAQAIELEELVAEEYDADRHDEDGPDNDDWIHDAYMRQASNNDDWMRE